MINQDTVLDQLIDALQVIYRVPMECNQAHYPRGYSTLNCYPMEGVLRSEPAFEQLDRLLPDWKFAFRRSEDEEAVMLTAAHPDLFGLHCSVALHQRAIDVLSGLVSPRAVLIGPVRYPPLRPPPGHRELILLAHRVVSALYDNPSVELFYARDESLIADYAISPLDYAISPLDYVIEAHPAHGRYGSLSLGPVYEGLSGWTIQVGTIADTGIILTARHPNLDPRPVYMRLCYRMPNTDPLISTIDLSDPPPVASVEQATEAPPPPSLHLWERL